MSIVPGGPVSASGVKDFFEELFNDLKTWLGKGKERNLPRTKSDFDSASLIEKVNYLENQIESLKSSAPSPEEYRHLYLVEKGSLYADDEVSYNHPYGGYIYIFSNSCDFRITVDGRPISNLPFRVYDGYTYRIPFGNSVTIEIIYYGNRGGADYAIYAHDTEPEAHGPIS